MSKYLDQFSPAADVGNPAPVQRAVIIASSQRCGSSLLGYTLGSTGAFGVPLEYFNQQNQKHWRMRFDVQTIHHFLDEVERVRTTPNGVFTIKCHYYQLNDVGSISDLFRRYGDCRFIAIKRRDLLRQAISRTIAQQTGVWFSGQKPRRTPAYDADKIAQNMRVLLRQRSQWDLAFSLTGVEPLEVFYEDLVASPREIISRISAFCSVNAEDLSLPSKPPIHGQISSLSHDWAAKFLADHSEGYEPILNGYLPLRSALTDIARASLHHLGVRRKSKAVWYRSPNRALEQ